MENGNWDKRVGLRATGGKCSPPNCENWSEIAENAMKLGRKGGRKWSESVRTWGDLDERRTRLAMIRETFDSSAWWEKTREKNAGKMRIF
jgi:hypothetical protein